jgi:hypothetical protein
MSGKQAKRLRQLLRQLQTSGAIEAGAWTVYGLQKHNRLIDVKKEDGTTKKETVEIGSTVWLNPKCPRSIYQQMKKRFKNLSWTQKAHAA